MREYTKEQLKNFTIEELKFFSDNQLKKLNINSLRSYLRIMEDLRKEDERIANFWQKIGIFRNGSITPSFLSPPNTNIFHNNRLGRVFVLK